MGTRVGQQGALERGQAHRPAMHRPKGRMRYRCPEKKRPKNLPIKKMRAERYICVQYALSLCVHHAAASTRVCVPLGAASAQHLFAAAHDTSRRCMVIDEKRLKSLGVLVAALHWSSLHDHVA